MSQEADLVDLLEGELEETELVRFEQVLRESKEKRREFLRLSRVRDAVEEIDPAANWSKKIEDVEYQKQITERVMKSIRRESRTRSSAQKDIALKIERDSSSS